MPESFSGGLVAVVVGGILQGSFFLPMKFTRRWQWENTWIGFATVAYLIAPWLLALLLIPHFPLMLGEVSVKTIVVTLLYGVGWGAGALSMGIAYKYVGMAISYAVVMGIASSIGTLVPLLVLSPDAVRTSRGFEVIVAVAISLLGTAVVAWAAWQRDSAKSAAPPAGGSANEVGQPQTREAARKNVTIGLVLCVASGVLASFGNLGFAFGAELSRRASELGAGPTGSSSAVWSVLCFPVFLWNFLYCVHLLNRNKTAKLFREPGSGTYWTLAALMGVIWLAGMAAYGSGALVLGNLGTSVGWVIFISAIILFGNLLGLMTGEWKGSSWKATTTMLAGVAILVLAVVIAGIPHVLD